MRNKSFDDKTIAELKAYVYALFDPLEDRPFYIGKGRGKSSNASLLFILSQRDFSH